MNRRRFVRAVKLVMMLHQRAFWAPTWDEQDELDLVSAIRLMRREAQRAKESDNEEEA